MADGLTSIVDLEFGPEGTLYAVELDADGWPATEGEFITPSAGGTIRACDVATGDCPILFDGLSLPTAVDVDEAGSIWVLQNDLLPFGTATVSMLP